MGGSRSTTIFDDGGDEWNVKWANEGGVANNELESPSLDRLSRAFVHASLESLKFAWCLEAGSVSSAARISSSSLEVGLGTRNELLLADEAGVSADRLDGAVCSESDDLLSGAKEGVFLEPKVLRAHAVVGARGCCLCLASITCRSHRESSRGSAYLIAMTAVSPKCVR